MQAFHQALEKECECQGRALPFALSPEPDDVLMRGQLAAVPKLENTTGCQTTISNTLFVDDGAFIFKSFGEMCKFLAVTEETFAKLGLLMHVGTTDGNGKLTQSETEAMCCPACPSTLFNKQLIPETMCFGDNNCFHVNCPNEFKHLGSQLVPTPSDERDIKIRTQQAAVQARQLENFWCTSQDLRIKRALFLATPANTALCSCECWAMTDKLHDQPSAFHHKTLHHVLGINMFAVERDRIKNEHLRNKLSVCNIADMVRHRQSNCIGKLMHMPSN